MYFVYILLCNDNSLYTGITTDLKKRFLAHQKGSASKYTRAKGVVEIIYSEKLDTKSDALKRELEIKGWSRAEKVKLAGQPGLHIK